MSAKWPLSRAWLPRAIFRWTYFGLSLPIVSGQRSISVTRLNARTSVLSVDSLDAQHRGVYKCMAQNKAGRTNFQSELAVNGASLSYIYFPFLFSFTYV